MSDFGKKLILIRNHLGLSQREVAELSGISQSTISLIESGRMLPTKNQVCLLTNFYVDAMKKERNEAQAAPKVFDGMSDYIPIQSRPRDNIENIMEA